MLARRAVFERVRAELRLPESNQRFGPPIIPYFLPFLVPDGDGLWYLTEDYAFCERARRCGFRVMADTTIRLVHDGGHGFTWEDAAAERPRYDTYVFNLPGPAGVSITPSPGPDARGRGPGLLLEPGPDT